MKFRLCPLALALGISTGCSDSEPPNQGAATVDEGSSTDGVVSPPEGTGSSTGPGSSSSGGEDYTSAGGEGSSSSGGEDYTSAGGEGSSSSGGLPSICDEAPSAVIDCGSINVYVCEGADLGETKGECNEEEVQACVLAAVADGDSFSYRDRRSTVGGQYDSSTSFHVNLEEGVWWREQGAQDLCYVDRGGVRDATGLSDCTDWDCISAITGPGNSIGDCGSEFDCK